MDALEAVKSRIEIREFQKKPIPKYIQVKVLEAARAAPSAWNRQLWHFILIEDKELLAKLGELAETGRYIKDSPFAIAFLIEKSYPQYNMVP